MANSLLAGLDGHRDSDRAEWTSDYHLYGRGCSGRWNRVISRTICEYAPGNNAGTVKISHPSRSAEVAQFFNTGAFVNPNDEAPGTYGNSSKGIIYGPAYADTDASILKDFTLPESFRLQFRAEAFNAFNQVNFSLPNTYANAGSAFGQIQSTVAGTGRQLQLALNFFGNWYGRLESRTPSPTEFLTQRFIRSAIASQ